VPELDVKNNGSTAKPKTSKSVALFFIDTIQQMIRLRTLQEMWDLAWKPLGYNLVAVCYCNWRTPHGRPVMIRPSPCLESKNLEKSKKMLQEYSNSLPNAQDNRESR